jgi:transcriptional regulator of acetoin/glycerol metabolism
MRTGGRGTCDSSITPFTVLMAETALLRADDLGLRAPEPARSSVDDMSLAEAEAFLIKKALARHGTINAAAKALGLSRSALYRRIAWYRL